MVVESVQYLKVLSGKVVTFLKVISSNLGSDTVFTVASCDFSIENLVLMTISKYQLQVCNTTISQLRCITEYMSLICSSCYNVLVFELVYELFNHFSHLFSLQR